MAKTLLKRLKINKFRALNRLEIEFGTHVTVICGKNGTSKSSILGIAAQIFSFETDYTKSASLQYQTLAGSKFKSLPGEHFRFSDQFDVPGSLDVEVELFDGYTEAPATATLELSRRGSTARPVVRKNSSVTKGNTSRNFTHPVIFLSLKRLTPIAAREYKVSDLDLLDQGKARFLALTNELLNKTASEATSTAGAINSAVAHAANYDQDSVSVGEDNAGQIMLALMSFRKLKDDYSDYKGGLLLIDEADAGLFPAAQTKLVEILNRESHDLSLQVVMTSHSPTLIEYTHEQSQRFPRRLKTVYLSDTYGAVQAMHDFSWSDINADLHTKTVASTSDVLLPQINVYYEDKEGHDLFNAAMYRHPAKKFIVALSDVSLGCSNYIQLVRRKVREFSHNSVICLDADTMGATAGLDAIVTLPGTLPPDQLLFEYLYNLPADSPLWINPLRFNRPVLTSIAAPLITALSVPQAPISIGALVTAYRAQSDERKKKVRELFKGFYNDAEFQAFIGQRKSEHSPWRHWARANVAACQDFAGRFTRRLIAVMRTGYSVDESKLVALRATVRDGS